MYCAVGYLIKASGYDSLAKRISSEHNYDYLADIRTPGVAEWAQTHGFRPDELAWIQPTYAPASRLKSPWGKLDGAVHVLVQDEENDQLIIVGDFKNINDAPCGGLACIRNGKYECLGNRFTKR